MPELEPFEDQLDGDDVLDLEGEAHYGIDNQARRQSVSGSEMSADFVIVTTALNRHGNAHRLTESKDGAGLKTDRHQRNPIVLVQHGMAPMKFPQIGAAVDPDGNYTVTKNRSRATSTVYFEQANPDANFVFGMVEGGKVFQMASIGFAAQKGRRLKIRQNDETLPEGVMSFIPQGRPNLLFTETQLTEWSIVDDGADPGAFRQYAEAGQINGCKPTEMFGYYLQDFARGLKPAWLGWTPERDEVSQRIEQAGVTINGKPEDVATFLQRVSVPSIDELSERAAKHFSSPEPKPIEQPLTEDEVESLVEDDLKQFQSPGVDAPENPGSVIPSTTPEFDMDALVKGVEQRISESSYNQMLESLSNNLNQKLDAELEAVNQEVRSLRDELSRASGSVD